MNLVTAQMEAKMEKKMEEKLANKMAEMTKKVALLEKFDRREREKENLENSENERIGKKIERSLTMERVYLNSVKPIPKPR